MRYATVTLLGLLAMGGMQALALPGASNALSKRATVLDFNHISDYPLGDPRNNGLAKPEPASDLARRDDYSVPDTPEDKLMRRVASGGAPPPKPPPPSPPNINNGRPVNRPRPGRPNLNEEPETVAMAIERIDLADTSDIIRTTPCGGAAKRSIGDQEANEPWHKRMSGQDKAFTWQEWKTIFEEVDHELGRLSQEEHPITKKIEIIFMGGISGVAFGSRGETGKTGDADYSLRTGTPDWARDILQKAVDRMVAKNPDKFEVIPEIGKPDPMNDQWDKHATEKAKETLSTVSNEMLWEGNYFKGFHGDDRMQLVSKMNRISEWRSRSGEFKERDQQDAKLFMQRLRGRMGRDDIMDMDTFANWGNMMGWDRDRTEAAVRVSLKIVVGDTMPGISEQIKEAVNRMKC